MASAHHSRRLWQILLILTSSLPNPASAEVFTGRHDTLQSFEYIMRFCFEPTPSGEDGTPTTDEERRRYGLLNVKLKFRSLVEDSMALLLFSEDWEGWGRLLRKEGTSEQLTCAEKEDLARRSGVEANFISHPNITVRDVVHPVYNREAEGNFTFRSGRPTWYFLAVSNCVDTCPTASYCEGPVQIEYDVSATNGNDFLRHFGVDKMGIHTACVLLAVAQSVVAAFATASRRELRRQQKYHHTIRLLIWSTWLMLLAIWLAFAHWAQFARDGRGIPEAHLAALFFQLFAEIFLVMQLLFVAKGWAIVRHKISTHGRVKIAVFVTMIAGVFVALQVRQWEGCLVPLAELNLPRLGSSLLRAGARTSIASDTSMCTRPLQASH
eukprot:scaffold109_cov252-Pinguiococcus_pyrenoidosus.AAC.29